MPNPLFESTSPLKPSLLSISFADDPSGSLGAQLVNLDKGDVSEMFTPSYATVGRLLDGDTVAKKSGVAVGDCIVAVNGSGFRRFAPDYPDDELEHLSGESATLTEEQKKEKDRVLHEKPGDNYAALLKKIKEVKSAADPNNPLVLELERHGWDSRVNNWPRFLQARDNNVPAAMTMLQEHEIWKEGYFPIDLTGEGLQDILKLKAVSEVDIIGASEDQPACVYVNYSKLQTLEQNHDPADVVRAFCVFTELMLAKSNNCRHPQTCQLIDLSGVSISAGFRVDILKQIYATFEPNYPETLAKMVLYPVSKVVASTSKMLLSFVNEQTQKKFVITDSLERVCTELGWDLKEVEEEGGVTEFVHKHEKEGDSLIF